MKKLFTLLVFSLSLSTYAQVGIGTVLPTATLDVVAANPTGAATTVDGIVIPRVTRQRAQSMTGITTSTIIYVNEVVTGTAAGSTINVTAIGFYYYNGTVWIALGGAGVSDHDWYKFGTTTAPTAITDDMFHTGDVSIGKNTASASKLDISENLTARNTVVNVTHTLPVATALETALIQTTTNLTETPTDANPTNLIGLKNNLLGLGSDTAGNNFHNRYGVYNDLSSPTARGFYYGMYNKFDLTNGLGNKSFKIGMYNSFTNTSAGSSAETSGLYNDFNYVASVAGNPTYGVRNVINAEGPIFYGISNAFGTSPSTAANFRYGVYNSFLDRAGDSFGMYNTINNTQNTGKNYGVYTNIASLSGTGIFYGDYVDANPTVGLTQTITGYYARIPGGSAAAGNKRYAAQFVGPVNISNSAGNDYYLPLDKGTNPLAGQIPISTTVNSGKETIWSTFSFQNTAATTIIAKYFGSLDSATVWNNNVTRIYIITDTDCTVNSSIFISLSGNLSSADDFRIESVTTDAGQFYVTVTNVSGANIAGGYSIPFAFTAFY
jgi:hypothetical protein